MSHDHHHEEKVPEFKEIIPFTLIVCAIFAYLATTLSTGALKKSATADLHQHSGLEHVAVSLKGREAVLSGNVATAQLKEEAETVVSGLPDISGIAANDIQIGFPVAEPAALLAPQPEGTIAQQPHGTVEAPPAPATATPVEDETAHTSPTDADDSHAQVAPANPPPAVQTRTNAFTSLLQQEKGKTLTITARVHAPFENQAAITEASHQLAALKKEISANGAVDAKRIHTEVRATLADDDNKDSRTSFSYVVE